MKIEKILKLLILLGIIIIGAILNVKYKIGIPCVFYMFTGLYCPGCGLTRAVIALLHFDIYKAFRYNMLIIVLIPFLLFYCFNRFVLDEKWKIPNYIWYFLVVITITFGVLRNIPYFSFLAPINI